VIPIRPLLLACGLACGATELAAGGPLPELLVYKPREIVAGELSSVGDGSMRPLMDAWLGAFRTWHPGIERGHWEFGDGAIAIGALVFELADMAPIARTFTAAELAPYRHQFAGDMMREPLMVHVATRENQDLYVAVNRRPGAPLPHRTREFLSFALSREGQRIAAEAAGCSALSAIEQARELERLDGFVARLDPALPPYRPVPGLAGAIRSVGSDGLKSLMDRWMREFTRRAPGVHPGPRWEHVGTLNGFHALLAGETDIAPMGRELWPSELTTYQAVRGQPAPIEIRVARGGFDTPQRTSAQAVFVNETNPLSQITIEQLAGIFGEPRTITRWGSLGLGGQWAERPILVCTPPLAAPNATSMRMMVLDGGPWTSEARQGSITETAAAIASDPGAIGFGGFEEGGPGIKVLAVARTGSDPYVSGSSESVSTGRYPFTRYMYIRLNPGPGTTVPPAVKEFLRFILSRDGQEPVLYSAYFPLTAAEAAEELSKLN